ncbi:hypothetical protein McanMca71_002106 [Microsporum canis]
MLESHHLCEGYFISDTLSLCFGTSSPGRVWDRLPGALPKDSRPPRPLAMEGLERAGDESMEDVFLQDDLCPTIAEHATQCQSLFHKCMAMPEIVPDPTVVDDQLARFSLWASNMDVYGPLNVSLDYRLRFSPTAADIIHQLLDIICDTLLSYGLKIKANGGLDIKIALLTLQKLPSDEDENAENVDSDQPLEDDDGPAEAVRITRASMYSVQDNEDLGFQDDDAEAADGNVDISAQVTVLDLEDKDDLGMTKLQHAVQAGDLGLVESLIQSGASVNFRDENGQTPLHYAAERGFFECMEALVEHGADLYIIDNSGFFPASLGRGCRARGRNYGTVVHGR